MLLFTLGTITAQPIKLDKTKLELIVGEEQALNATTSPYGQSVTWTSSDANKATVEGSYGEAKVIARAAGTINMNATFGGQTVSCTVTIYDPPQSGISINGVTWAIYNVNSHGAFTAKTSDAGMFYQWNRKISWSTSDPLISSPSGNSWDASIPSGTSWEEANDPCPVGWRVPTYNELDNLYKVGCAKATVNGKIGLKCGNGGNAIFLPVVRHRVDTGHIPQGSPHSIGRYLSATECGGNSAWGINITTRYTLELIGSTRAEAASVRCVKK